MQSIALWKHGGYFSAYLHIASSKEKTVQQFFMNTPDAAQLARLANQFRMEGNVLDIAPFGSGHINDTYRVNTDAADSYLLQRINHHVFRNVPALMDNMELVTSHLKQKYRLLNEKDPDSRVLTLIGHESGKSFHEDAEGSFWRMFVLLPHTRSYDIVETPQQAREGGRAFGQFQRLLSDLDATRIHEVLPHFHHIGKRLERLDEAVAKDAFGRVAGVVDELAFVAARKDRMQTIQHMAAEGLLPLRITHNDTKFNNVLLDGNDQFQCVIDLDTVMPGYVACDFGDAIRSIINRAAEDEADVERVKLNIPLFEAYAEGYFEQAHHFLTSHETDSLFAGVLLLPYMQTVRFLTDFVEGDHYYKIHHAQHNLQRTRAQLRLVEELEKHEPELRVILQRIADKYRKN